VRSRRCVVVLLLATALSGCTRDSGPVTLTVDPQTALMDVPVVTTVTGLDGGAAVTVEADAVDADGVRWTSTADLTADGDGTVSLDRPSTGGSYTGAHAMGLLTTMTPQGATTKTYIAPPGDTQPVTLHVRTGDQEVASTTVQRQTGLAAGVRTRVFRPATSGLYGTLFLPKDTSRRRPAVLAIGGSDGGEGLDFAAALMAAHGYPTLSLAYFAAPGLPKTLRNVPLEYFATALTLLAHQPGVDPEHVLTWGVSRGGEAALLLGVHFPQLVGGVVAAVSSDHVLGSYPPGGASWTLRGKPLPIGASSDFSRPGAPSSPASVIPVERVDGPLVTICGVEDLLIPSCPFATAMAARRGQRGAALGDVHLQYPNAGHAVGSLGAYITSRSTSGTTATGAELQLGGSEVDNGEAAGAARARLYALLQSLG
jgi:acetyl esterase/lipase